MKKLKILIIIIVILIIIFIILLSILNLKKGNNVFETSKGDPGEEVTYDSTKIEDVTDNIDYFTVINCVYQYFDSINLSSSKFENEEYTEEQFHQDVYNLLSENYIKNNNINLNNVMKYVDSIEQKMLFIPLKMKVVKTYNTNSYLVYGYLQTLSNEYVKDVYLYVNMDLNNKTFSIEPILNNNLEFEDIVYKNDIDSIEKNDMNTYQESKINNEKVSEEYFLMMKRTMLAKPEYIYNYLDNDYKQKRFGDINNFVKYIQENQSEIYKTQFTKYLVNNYEGYTEYVIQDQYQNLYIFDVTNPMQFTLKLDTYTIPTDKFKEQYDTGKNDTKVMLNVDKWISMLNNRDYKSAYNLLDETFRNNNFGSEEKFEEYMRQNYSSHYEIEYGDYQEEMNTFIQKINLKDITNSNAEVKQMTIIMQLKDNYNFVMSFS